MSQYKGITFQFSKTNLLITGGVEFYWGCEIVLLGFHCY